MRSSLKDLAEVEYGADHKHVNDVDGPFPIYGTGGVMGMAREYLFDGPFILVGRKGTLGNPQFSATPGWVIDTAYCVRPKKGIDAKWLFYNLRHFDLKSLNEATGVPSISRDYLYRVRFETPKFEEQRRIAEVLSTVDNLIEKTEVLIAKIHVEYEGVFADMFTLDSTWTAWVLGDCLAMKPKNGFSPKEADGYTGMFVLGLGCLTPHGYRPVQLKDAPAQHPKAKAAMLHDGDLLVSRSNTRELVGLPGIFKGGNGNVIYPDLMIRLVANEKTTNEFLELVLRSPSVRRQVVASAVGTSGSMVKTSSTRLCSTNVWIPRLDTQKKILTGLGILKSRIAIEQDSLEKLRAIKLGLMADLLSGRVIGGSAA